MHRIAWLLTLTCSSLFGQGSIEGTVLNSVTKTGISGVAIVYYTPQAVRYNATSDGAGKFRITGMQAGNYLGSFEKEDFDPGLPPPLSVRRLTIAGQDAVQVTVEMIPLAILRGRVLDQDGNPVAGAKVERRGPALMHPREEVVTGEDGRFEFSKLPPGTLTLVARPKPMASPSDAIRVEPIATYYPSETDPEQAQAITIRPGAEQANYDIRLRSVPVYRVRGRVLDAGGKPAEGMTVRIGRFSLGTTTGVSVAGNGTQEIAFGGGVEFDSATVVSNKDGAFEFPSVREGDWIVQAESEWKYHEETKKDTQDTGQARAFVARRDAEDLEIRLASNFELSATVEWEGLTRAPANFFAPLMMRSIDGGQSVVGSIKPDGTARFERVFPGRYLLSSPMGMMRDYYLSSAVSGGRDILGQPVQLNSGMPPLHILFKKGAASIRATIERAQAATVVLLPAAQPFDFVRTMEVAAGGSFETSSLRPGDYLVAAFDHADANKLRNPAFLLNFLPSTKRVRVEESGVAQVELSLNRWPE